MAVTVLGAAPPRPAGRCVLGGAIAPDALAQSAPSVPVRGYVIDAQTKQPLPETMLKIARIARPAITDARGYFETDPLPPGSYGVAIHRLGYEAVTEVWEIGADGAMFMIELDPDPIELEAITVTKRRLDRRSRASGDAVRVFERRDLLSSAAADVQQWIAPGSTPFRSRATC